MGAQLAEARRRLRLVFEGFTLYTALRTSQELGGIDFKETLNTLGRVYDVYLSHPDEQSLIEASETRWTNFGSQVSIKGMLVAFLYDLKIRKESGGKLTLAIAIESSSAAASLPTRTEMKL